MPHLRTRISASRLQYPCMKYGFAIILLSICGFIFAEPEILVNQRFANRLSLKAGDLVELSLAGDMKNARAFRVAQIYVEKPDPYVVPLKRNMIKMHLSDLEQLIERPDQLDIISIRVRKGADAHTLAAKLNSEAIGFTAVSAQQLAEQNSTTFEVVSRFHEAIAFITMMAGAIFIFALVVMRVEDQRKNFAILTVTGISRKTILKTLVLESIFFAFVASFLGAGIGIFAAKVVNLYYQNFYQTSLIFARVTPSILLRAATVSFLLGIVAGTFSWFRLRRLQVLQELGR
jgi:ABC-type antimicrobial peptide transport system permease subunit